MSAWHDGELHGRRAVAVARHVGRCPGCRAELVALDRLSSSLRRLRGEPVVPAVLARLEATARRVTG